MTSIKKTIFLRCGQRITGLLGIGIGIGLAFTMPAAAHVTLEQPQAEAGSSYKAVLRVGHACAGATTTTAITVRLPVGFAGAKPIPKAGWITTVQRAALAQPYESHGRRVTEEVTTVSWQAASPASALSGDFFDEFVVRGQLPESPGTLWFKVLQTCDVGASDWAQVPATGSSVKGLSLPAAPLDIMPAGHGGHNH
jgi:periplasmic copper chaperone A